MSSISANAAPRTPKPSLFKAAAARGRAGRKLRERLIVASLVGCAVISALTTCIIIGTLATETTHFFRLPEATGITEFFTGLEWNPMLGSDPVFGIWPLISGTVMVAFFAAIVALPLGLITAIYLSEYAHPRVRAVLKPILEILAGVPTVVYGFFAVTILTPALQSLTSWLNGSIGVHLAGPTQWAFHTLGTGWTVSNDAFFGSFKAFNLFSGGVTVGIMCLPIVCSLSEDALRATPRSLREAAYGLGATKFDVSVRVVTPAALSGVIAAFLLAIARAVGETMIVALAAGNLAQLTIDPREPSQTITAYMAQMFMGDVSNLGVKYYSAYAAASVLFVMTFVLTLLGARVLAKYREEYE